jgi:hypothetical protein
MWEKNDSAKTISYSPAASKHSGTDADGIALLPFKTGFKLYWVNCKPLAREWQFLFGEKTLQILSGQVRSLLLRTFTNFAAWLKRCGIETVVLESTDIHWISLDKVFEQHGYRIRVVNPRHVKHVPSLTKTDVLDCQWIQKLQSFGLLNGSFRPDQQIRKLRTYMRLRQLSRSQYSSCAPHAKRRSSK